MPISFSYDKEKEVLYGVMEGVLSLEEYKKAMESTAHSKEFSPGSGTLWDMREVDFRKINRAFEKHVVEILKSLPTRGNPNVACVVKGDLGFGMGRMFEFLSSDLPQNIRIFKEYDKAEKWVLEKQV